MSGLEGGFGLYRGGSRIPGYRLQTEFREKWEPLKVLEVGSASCLSEETRLSVVGTRTGGRRSRQGPKERERKVAKLEPWLRTSGSAPRPVSSGLWLAA